eukprot:superscaffoldBa00000547_g5558
MSQHQKQRQQLQMLPAAKSVQNTEPGTSGHLNEPQNASDVEAQMAQQARKKIQARLKKAKLFQKYRDLQETLLNWKNYFRRFHLLLHLEELQLKTEVEKYNQDDVTMFRDKNTKNLLILRIAGVTGSSSSLLPGNQVLVTPLDKSGGFENAVYKGWIQHEDAEQVYLQLCEKFLRHFKEGMRFKVNFIVNRLPLRIQHRAAALVHRHKLKEVLFPTGNFSSHHSCVHRPLESENNPEQCIAIQHIVAASAKPAPYLVFGPPGTGLVKPNKCQVVLAGDPKQSGPIVTSKLAEKHGMDVSLLERLMGDIDLYKSHETHGFNSCFVTKLLRNYRSHPAILKIPNELFYKGQLQPYAPKENCSQYCKWKRLPKKGFPLIFHGVAGTDERAANCPSVYNTAEMEVLKEYLKALIDYLHKKGVTQIGPGEIGIIAPYRKQVEKIQIALQMDKDLRKENLENILVGSVEKFQGKEFNVILVSTVRSNPKLTAHKQRFTLGFVNNEKRFNVAITRARALLIVVGDPRVLKADQLWNKFIHYCAKEGGYRGITVSAEEESHQASVPVFGIKKSKNKKPDEKLNLKCEITSLYLDQWDHQPEQNCNGVAILQPEEAVSGVRARRELASQLMNRLRTDPDQLISDKRGIRITSDHVFEDGTLYLQVESASEYVVNLTVENTGRKPVYFTYYTPLRWLRFFTLNDERKVTKTNPLTLNPGDGYEIQVRFHCSLVGFYPATLAFEFQPDLHSTPFHIVRFIEAQCMTTTFFLRSPPHAHHDGINICLRCMLFYDTFVDIAPNKRDTLDHRTVEQRASQLWYDARKLRLTASTAKRVPTRGNPQNYIRQHLYPSFHGNAATHHGIESEALAFQWLQNRGYVVTRRGTVVCAGEPWLSASPDGVLNSEELLEIKCPFLTGNESLEDLIRSQRYDVKMVEGKYQLQKNGQRRFYMQVQLGMFCTGLRIGLRDIYNNEFRARNAGTKDPNFGSVLYALKVSNKITRRGDTIRFTSSVRALYLDQWHSSRDPQPQRTQNGAASPGPVRTVPSSEEAATGVRARRKLASLLMNKLKTNRAQFISDKRGVRITSDPQFEDGKLCLCVENTYEYVVNLTVENTGTEPVYFTYYTPLHWLKYFTLNDERKVTKTNPLTLNPGDGYEIQVRFHCSLVGFYPATLAFEFQPDLHSTPFHIVRFIEAQCMTSLGLELAPVAPYKPRSLPVFIPETCFTIVDGQPPERLSEMRLRNEVTLKVYKIPPYMNQLIQSLKKCTPYSDGRIAKLRCPLSWENYSEKFQLLLYLEELQMEVDIRRYNIPNNDREHACMVRDRINKKLLILEVPGVSENRPSVLRGDQLLVLFDPQLEGNPEQLQAVQHIVAGSSKPAPYLVFGPPGTGKTVTLVEAIKQIEKTQTSCHILACAPSNSAADLLCEKIVVHVDKRKVYRMYASSRDPKCVPERLKACSNLVGECYVYPAKEELMEYKILVTTLLTAGRLVTGNIPTGHFTHVFVDEAGHAVEPECLIPLAGLLHAESGQVVLAGDPKQLGPILRSPFALKFGMGRSHPAILKIPNELFYDGELQVCANELRNSYCRWEYLPKKDFPVIFHGVTGIDEREASSPSFFNRAEVEVLMDYVKKLLETQAKKGLATIKPQDIGIIAPYRKQVQKIRKALEKVGKDLKRTDMDDLKVGSVEEFQGQERRVILVSTVRSSRDYAEIDKQFNLGFVKNEKRFNVAVTRAKALLIVVGNPIVLNADPVWARFIQYCRNEGGYTGFIHAEEEEDMVARLAALYIQIEAEVETAESVVQQHLDPEWRNDL